MFDYFCLSFDNWLLFGGGCMYFGGILVDIVVVMCLYFECVFLYLVGVLFDYVWGGYIDISMCCMLDIGCYG